MSTPATFGFDVGTSSSKGVLVGRDGTVLGLTQRFHRPARLRPGHVEMRADLWWDELVDVAAELTATCDVDVEGIGVSGMGPCTLLTDEDDRPLRPAILYGVDTRASAQINRLDAELGADAILARCGSTLSSQAVGPKLAWLAEHEPAVMARARRLYMPASWLVRRLTGTYALDRHSASQCTPLFDAEQLGWYRPWCEKICPGLELPPLFWADHVAGTTSNEVGGIPAGTPVALGSIDAWIEAVSVGAHRPGDLMVMYGSTQFLIATIDAPLRSPSMWGTTGAFADTYSLAGGMATSGVLLDWLEGLTGTPVASLLAEAAQSDPGARGLLVLPYFAGERTPLMDPLARGGVLGLTLQHTLGDLVRATVEALAFGVRHNIETMRAAGARIERVVAVGGGTRSPLWSQVVSDVTGLPQVLPATRIGASYGAAFLAAGLTRDVDIDRWNPPAGEVVPDASTIRAHDDRYALYRELYETTAAIAHALAEGS